MGLDMDPDFFFDDIDGTHSVDHHKSLFFLRKIKISGSHFLVEIPAVGFHPVFSSTPTHAFLDFLGRDIDE
jgi:hypothetical protein